jgi:hypothetical protein
LRPTGRAFGGTLSRMSDEWDLIETRQHGITDVRQLAAMGVTRGMIAAQIDAGRWQWVVPRVYATFTGPLPRAARLEAALRYGGAAAVLSHRTAAEQWGLVPIAEGPVHITVPYGASAVSQPPLMIVHRSRAFDHIVVALEPPVTRRADTAIDMAAAEDDARAARRTLTEVLVTGRVPPVDVERRLEERPPPRYRQALLAAVRLVRLGVQSVLEECYAVEVEQAHGLPAGRRQGPFAVDGVTLYEDVVYDEAGAALTIRLDGRTHLLAGVAFRDRRRDNAAELAGRSRLVYGWRDLSADPCGAARDVVTVLRRRGWIGTPHCCHRCAHRGDWPLAS